MIQKSRLKNGVATLALMTAGAMALSINGATHAQPQEPDMGIVQQVDLMAFTSAYQEVEIIRRDYIPRAEQAESTRDKTQILREAHERMRAAIERKGLTVEQYSHTSMAVSQDPELKEQVIQMLQEQHS